MAKYHITDKGETKVCHAESGGCPFGDDPDHYPTRAAAQVGFEDNQSSLATVSLSKSNRFSSFGNIPKYPSGKTIDQAWEERFADRFAWEKEHGMPLTYANAEKSDRFDELLETPLPGIEQDGMDLMPTAKKKYAEWYLRAYSSKGSEDLKKHPNYFDDEQCDEWGDSRYYYFKNDISGLDASAQIQKQQAVMAMVNENANADLIEEGIPPWSALHPGIESKMAELRNIKNDLDRSQRNFEPEKSLNAVEGLLNSGSITQEDFNLIQRTVEMQSSNEDTRSMRKIGIDFYSLPKNLKELSDSKEKLRQLEPLLEKVKENQATDPLSKYAFNSLMVDVATNRAKVTKLTKECKPGLDYLKVSKNKLKGMIKENQADSRKMDSLKKEIWTSGWPDPKVKRPEMPEGFLS